MRVEFVIESDETNADDIMQHYFIPREDDEISILVDGVETLYHVVEGKWTRAK